MKRSLFKGTFLTLAMIAASATGPAAFGRTIPEVQRFLVQELHHMEAAPPLAPAADRPESMAEYQLSLFRLRIKAEFGFDAGIGKITLEPVAEFFWE